MENIKKRIYSIKSIEKDNLFKLQECSQYNSYIQEFEIQNAKFSYAINGGGVVAILTYLSHKSAGIDSNWYNVIISLVLGLVFNSISQNLLYVRKHHQKNKSMEEYDVNLDKISYADAQTMYHASYQPEHEAYRSELSKYIDAISKNIEKKEEIMKTDSEALLFIALIFSLFSNPIIPIISAFLFLKAL